MLWGWLRTNAPCLHTRDVALYQTCLRTTRKWNQLKYHLPMISCLNINDVFGLQVYIQSLRSKVPIRENRDFDSLITQVELHGPAKGLGARAKLNCTSGIGPKPVGSWLGANNQLTLAISCWPDQPLPISCWFQVPTNTRLALGWQAFHVWSCWGFSSISIL